MRNKRSPEENKRFFLSVEITPSLRERLEKLSQAGDAPIPLSGLVRKALEEFLTSRGLPERKK